MFINSATPYRRRIRLNGLIALLGLCLFSAAAGAASSKPALDWQPWSQQRLAHAADKQRLVYLYVEAVWCHWCHVMQQTTFADPAVQAYLSQHFVLSRVDHDARPDVADRYRAWGWPANVFLDAQGQELVLRAGYIAPEAFLRLLKALVADPTPEQAAKLEVVQGAGKSSLGKSLRGQLEQRHIDAFDTKNAGLVGAQKFLDRPHVEYALRRALHGDAAAAKRARRTLDAASALLDPAWGGIYQYSTGGRWDRPHYEKLLRVQAAYLRIYALAYKQWRNQRDLRVMRAIQSYVQGHLAAGDGSYYISQDADQVQGQKAHAFFAQDAQQRAALEAPRVDKSRYVQANAEWLDGLCEAYAASAKPELLEQAQRLGGWLLLQRDGVFSRGPDGPAGEYFADNIAAIQALISLYRVTADKRWIDAAMHSADVVADKFARQPVGYLPRPVVSSAGLRGSQPVVQDNIQAARSFNLLYQYSGLPRYQRNAMHAMRYLSLPSVALARIEDSGILLVDDELAQPPHHLSVIGVADDAGASLFRTALATAGSYQRIDWQRSGGPALLRSEVKYPKLSQAAGYVCSASRCSLPSLNSDKFAQRIQSLLFSQAVE